MFIFFLAASFTYRNEYYLLIDILSRKRLFTIWSRPDFPGSQCLSIILKNLYNT